MKRYVSIFQKSIQSHRDLKQRGGKLSGVHMVEPHNPKVEDKTTLMHDQLLNQHMAMRH